MPPINPLLNPMQKSMSLAKNALTGMGNQLKSSMNRLNNPQQAPVQPPMNSQALQSQMMDTIRQYQQSGFGTPQMAQQAFSQQVDNFRPQYQELRNAEAQALAAPATAFNQFNQQNGAVGGPSAMARLQSAFQDMGRAQSNRDVMADVLGQSQGRIGDLANNAYDTFQAQQANIGQRYNMLSPIFGALQQTEESQRGRDFTGSQNAIQQAFADRQFQAARDDAMYGRDWQKQMFEYQKQQDAQAAARAASGGGGGYGGMFGGGGSYGDEVMPTPVDTQASGSVQIDNKDLLNAQKERIPVSIQIRDTIKMINDPNFKGSKQILKNILTKLQQQDKDLVQRIQSYHRSTADLGSRSTGTPTGSAGATFGGIGNMAKAIQSPLSGMRMSW
jgi:hypothetical protein